MLLAAIAALTIAFPGAGRKLPWVEKAYMIGAVPRGVTNLTVQTKNVPIYRTGAWATMVDVVEGVNSVEIVYGESCTNHTFIVGAKPKVSASESEQGQVKAPEKKWEKLDYCGDTPVPHPAGKKPEEIFIYIDPGHGGTDTGALSPHGFFEKDANLLQAKALKKELLSRGYNVLMTREDDRALVLTERPRDATEKKADAFISIHHNAPSVGQDASTARHTAVYYWNDIGKRLSDSVIDRLAGALDGEVSSKGALFANFAVTRNPEIPSILVEVDFMTHPEGEEAIFDHTRRAWIAKAIADGFADWTRCGDDIQKGDSQPCVE